MNDIKVGDRVFNLVSEHIGIVKSIYQELNTAIIETTVGIEKARLDNLVKAKAKKDPEGDFESKKATLLDRIKARFKND